MRRLPSLIALAAVATASSAALADAPRDRRCFAPGVNTVACIEEAADRPRRDVTGSTHLSLIPTGNLVPAGDFDLSSHELGFLRAAVGVNDHLELSVSFPTIPVVVNAGARVSLTGPESPLKVVVGAGAWAPLWDGGAAVGQYTATVAWQGARTNLHATASVVPYDDDDELVFGYAAGVLHQLDDGKALAVDLTRFAHVDRCGPGCGDVSTMHGGVVAMKLFFEQTEVDLGLFVGFDIDDDDTPVLPLISIARRY
jgi:hypothetical protein